MKTISQNEIYLDYLNNFLTVAKFAEHYNLSEIEARNLIKKGKAAHHLKTLDRSTVIDSVWEEYMDMETREALNTLCETENYQEVNAKYEGYTLAELIKELFN